MAGRGGDAMWHVKAEVRSPAAPPAAGMSSSPYPFSAPVNNANRPTNAGVYGAGGTPFMASQTPTPTPFNAPHSQPQPMYATGAGAIAPSMPVPQSQPHPLSSMPFDLDFLDSSTGALPPLMAGPALAHSDSGPSIDLDLNLGLDSSVQPPLHTLPGDNPMTGGGAGAGAGGAQSMHLFSDVSSVGTASGSDASPDHPGLSPSTGSENTPHSPNTPVTPLSPAQTVPASMGRPLQHIRPQMHGSAYPQHLPPLHPNTAMPGSVPLPLYPLSAAALPPALPLGGQPQRPTYTPQQPPSIYGQIKQSPSPIPFGMNAPSHLPQPSVRASGAPALPIPPAVAGSTSATSSAAAKKPKKEKGAMASSAKGRKGGASGRGKAGGGGSPSSSDSDEGKKADGVAGGGGGDSSSSDSRSKRERNKVSAMKYRKRRKVYLDGLEVKVGELNDTVMSLQTENKVCNTENDNANADAAAAAVTVCNARVEPLKAIARTSDCDSSDLRLDAPNTLTPSPLALSLIALLFPPLPSPSPPFPELTPPHTPPPPTLSPSAGASDRRYRTVRLSIVPDPDPDPTDCIDFLSDTTTTTTTASTSLVTTPAPPSPPPLPRPSPPARRFSLSTEHCHFAMTGADEERWAEFMLALPPSPIAHDQTAVAAAAEL